MDGNAAPAGPGGADEPEPQPLAIIRCKSRNCRHEFFRLYRDIAGRNFLAIGGQRVYVFAGSRIMLFCPVCGFPYVWHGTVKRDQLTGGVLRPKL